MVPEGISPGFDYNVGKARTRAFTPPPLSSLPDTLQLPTQLPTLPKPSPIPKKAILPKDLDDSTYIAAFLREFGIKPGQTGFFEDKAGDNMPINEDLFMSRGKKTKAAKFGRGPYMALLAQGLKDPDEIWLQWIKNAAGIWVLKNVISKSGKGKTAVIVLQSLTRPTTAGAAQPASHPKTVKPKKPKMPILTNTAQACYYIKNNPGSGKPPGLRKQGSDSAYRNASLSYI